jgi:hypothetical protein
MKNSIITYLLGFFFLISCFKALSETSADPDTNACLEINGKITNAAEGSEAICLIELFNANTLVSWANLKEGKKTFKFNLKKNAVYTIRISKRGYISRLVGIDTKLAADKEDLYSFSFETKLIKTSELEKLNKEFLDFPIALIYFDPKKDCFVYDKEYTTRLKKEIVMK